VRSKVAEDAKNDVEKVSDDGHPHKAKKVKHLPQRCENLQETQINYLSSVNFEHYLQSGGRRLFGEISSLNRAP